MKNPIQSIKSERGQIYWDRLTSEFLGQEVKDQAVLRAIGKIDDAIGTQEFIDQFINQPGFADLVVFFNKQPKRFENDDVFRLTHEILNHYREQLPLVNPHDITYLSGDRLPFLETWIQIIDRQGLPEDQWITFLNEEIKLCFPESLRLATDLYFLMIRSRILEPQLQQLRQTYFDSAKFHFYKIDAVNLAKCFDPRFAYTLSHLIHAGKLQPRYDLFTKTEQWNWISDSLLSGMVQFPEILNPQVTFAFGTPGPEAYNPSWFKFNETEMEAIFGERIKDAYLLLTKSFTISEQMPAGERKAIALAQAEARKLFDQVDLAPRPKALPPLKAAKVRSSMRKPTKKKVPTDSPISQES